MVYGSEYWAVNKMDMQRIGTVDQWCLRRILGIRWHDFCQKCRHPSRDQPATTFIHYFILLFHFLLGILHEWMRTQMLAKPSSNLLQRTEGDHQLTHDILSSLDLGIHEARDLAENRPLCRLMSLHSATHS